jgi:hypothetical protein
VQLGALTFLFTESRRARGGGIPGAGVAARRASRALGAEHFAAENATGAGLSIDAALTLALTTALAAGAA